MNFLKDREKQDMRIMKIVLITAGVVLAATAAAVVVYKVVKKRFNLNFDCDECDFSDEDCLADEDEGFAPEFVEEGKKCAEKVADEAGKIAEKVAEKAEEATK